MPSYTRYFAGDLDNEGAANLDITVGWSPADRWVVTGLFQKNFDKDFQGFRRPGVISGSNDWNVFVSASYYFRLSLMLDPNCSQQIQFYDKLLMPNE